jgi:hypothetical protein
MHQLPLNLLKHWDKKAQIKLLKKDRERALGFIQNKRQKLRKIVYINYSI